MDGINEFRITFYNRNYGMLTGFCCFAGLEVPTSGQAEVYVPVIRGHVTCNLAKVVDAMIMDNPIVDEYDPFELPETA